MFTECNRFGGIHTVEANLCMRLDEGRIQDRNSGKEREKRVEGEGGRLLSQQRDVIA